MNLLVARDDRHRGASLTPFRRFGHTRGGHCHPCGHADEGGVEGMESGEKDDAAVPLHDQNGLEQNEDEQNGREFDGTFFHTRRGRADEGE